ncbi:MAG: type II toxin-antitoxin system VapC family toxin [Thermocrispum sp.]
MKVVDANVLLYAVNSDTPHHRTARDWLDHALNGEQTVGFTWLALLAFTRISTHPGIFARPLTVTEAFDVTEGWLERPGAVIVDPTHRHPAILRGIIEPLGTAGNLLNDAHLAAVAVEHGAEVVTFDADFTRFAGVKVGRLG